MFHGNYKSLKRDQLGDEYFWRISRWGQHGNKNWTGSLWTLVSDSAAISCIFAELWWHWIPLLPRFVVVVSYSEAMGNLLQDVSQVQRKHSCSNNVAQEPGSVAKSGAHLFPSHIIICWRDRWMLASQITKVI